MTVQYSKSRKSNYQASSFGFTVPHMNDILSAQDTRVVEDILIAQLEVARDQLTTNAGISTDLGADSLDIMEIAMALEERFDLSFPDEDWEKVQTVGDLFEILAESLRVPRRQ
jgi:acyl carrier protein